MRQRLLLFAGCVLVVAGLAVFAVFVYVNEKLKQAAGWLV